MTYLIPFLILLAIVLYACFIHGWKPTSPREKADKLKADFDYKEWEIKHFWNMVRKVNGK